MTEDRIAAEKSRLRRELLAARKALPEEYRRKAGASIAAQLLASLSYASARTVFVYVSMPGEPDTSRLIRQALAEGKRVYVPKCTGGEMLAVRIESPADLLPGTMGIPEPQDTEDTKTAGELDLIIVPCVAAAEDGRRLGHGGGYYDRFLAGGSDNAVCLCFRRMLCEAIPSEKTDVRIPRILTEDF